MLGNFCKGVKIIHFSSEIIFGQLFFRHLVIFIWSHWLQGSQFAFAANKKQQKEEKGTY